MYILLDLDDCILNVSHESNLVNYLKSKLDEPEMFNRRGRFLDLKVEICNHVFNMAGYTRPYLREFLEVCTRHFKVAVWSAGTYEYVHACVNEIFHNIPRPIVVLTGNDKEDIPGTGDYHKPLYKFFQLVPGANEKNTVLIDDKKSNFYGYVNNGILIPPFTRNYITDDDALPKVLKWLLDNKDSSDIRTVDKSKIFIEPITYVEDRVEATHEFRIPIRIKQDKIRITIS